MYIYLDNKYTKWYYAIIQAAQNRRLESNIRVEKHHIIPRSLGGGNEVTNLVALTLREHYICHLLLTKMCTGKALHKMIRAAWMMAKTRKNIPVTSRTYAYLKEQAAPLSEEHKKKIGEANRKKSQDPEVSRKKSEAAKKKWQDPEISQKMLEGIKKRSQNPEYRWEMSIARRGVPKSQEHIANMRNRPQDNITLTCTHCDKTGDYKNMMRWHMDRCAHNPNRIKDKDPKLVTCFKCGYSTKQSPNFYKNHNENCKY